jgi:hypothetical protein
MVRARFRKLVLLSAVSALTLLVGACEPIENAPPGGGAIETETFRLGPFNLTPAGQSGDTDLGFETNVPRPSGVFGIKTMNFDIVDEAGNPVPREAAHLHHIVMSSNAAPEPYCFGSERFAGAGAERNPIILPDPYAYLVDANDTWGATWEVVNESDQPLNNIYIEYEIGLQRGANAENSRGVRAFFLDVTGCRAAYNVPGDGGPGSVHTATRTWTAPWDGYLVTAVGHMHGGGLNLTIRDELSGRECRMNATYSDDHGHGGGGGDHGHMSPPYEISRCPIHVRFEQGQRFTVISRYDNSQPIQGAMGIVRAYAWPGQQ